MTDAQWNQTIDQARALAPYQNATGMQVTSAVLAAMVWVAENPRAGFVEADEMDHARCLEVQRPYLGSVECHYTDWTPLQNRINRFADAEAYRDAIGGARLMETTGLGHTRLLSDEGVVRAVVAHVRG